MLLPVGRSIIGLWYSKLTGRWVCPYHVWPLNPATCFHGRGRRSKASRQNTVSWQQEGEEGVLWAWLCGRCVVLPIQEMRSAAVLWNACALWRCGCCVFIVRWVEGFQWTLGGQLISQWELVSLRHWMLHCGHGLAPPFHSSFWMNVLCFRSHIPRIWALKWAWSGSLTSLMWLGVVSCMCHAYTLILP